MNKTIFIILILMMSLFVVADNNSSEDEDTIPFYWLIFYPIPDIYNATLVPEQPSVLNNYVKCDFDYYGLDIFYNFRYEWYINGELTDETSEHYFRYKLNEGDTISCKVISNLDFLFLDELESPTVEIQGIRDNPYNPVIFLNGELIWYHYGYYDKYNNKDIYLDIKPLKKAAENCIEDEDGMCDFNFTFSCLKGNFTDKDVNLRFRTLS